MEEAIQLYAQDHDYENWHLKDLVETCKNRGLKCTRTKSEIVERLVRDDTKFLHKTKEYLENYGPDFSQRNEKLWLNRVKLEGMQKCELVEQCKYRNINVSGDMRTLCTNIKEHDLFTFERMKNFHDRYM